MDDPTEPDATPRTEDAAPEMDLDAGRGDAKAHADAVSDATWGNSSSPRAVMPGIITGDVGPKSRMAAQLRDLSRRERSTYGEVPRGTNVPGTGRYVLLPMLLVPIVLLVVFVAIWWWLAQ